MNGKLNNIIMNEQTTTVCNELIAEFMGLKAGDKMYMIPGNPIQQPSSALKYDKDWNWLMPVIDKIEKTKHWLSMDENNIFFYNEEYEHVAEIYMNHELPRIEVFHAIVVGFVEWWNKTAEARKKREEAVQQHKLNMNSKLIAEFIGAWKYRPYGTEGYIQMDEDLRELDEAEFDHNWNWIMPVVSEINAITGHSDKAREYLEDNDYIPYRLGGVMVDTDLGGVYTEVVEFIKWWNNEKSSRD